MTSSYWSVDAFLSENTVSLLSSLFLVLPAHHCSTLDTPIYADTIWLFDNNQRLPCTFLLDVPNLGHLEGTNERDASPALLIHLVIPC